jgi:hypothetical protein
MKETPLTTWTSYVHQYGLLRPITETADEVERQVYASQQLYNAMIRLENAYRRENSAMEDARSPALLKIKKQLVVQWGLQEDLRDEIKALEGNKPKAKGDALKSHRAALKKLQATMKPIKARIKELRDERAAAWEVLSKDPGYIQEKKYILEVVSAGYQKLYDEQVSDKGLAKGTWSTTWGTHNLLKASVEQAKKKWDGMLRQRERFDEGQLGVQIMPPVPVARIFNTEKPPFLLIDPVDPRAFDPSVPKGERKRLSRTTVRMRIGHVLGHRTPIWAVWPMILHRPIPPGAVITGASVNRHMEANRVRWTLQITFKVPATPPVVPRTNKTVALDLGWRKMEGGGLRTFFWQDAAGEKGEWQLPPAVSDRLKKVDDLKSIRGTHQLELQKSLLAIFSNRASLDPDLRLAVKGLDKWKSPQHYLDLLRYEAVMPRIAARLIREWYYGNRAVTSEDSADRYNGDLHLWQYQTGVSSGAIRHRKALHERFALWLATTYDVIVLEKFKIPEVKDKPLPEDKDMDMPDSIKSMKKKASRQRDMAAPGYARTAIVNAAKKFGKTVLLVPAQCTTRTCAHCGFNEKWEEEHVLIHTCGRCDKTYDQDDNASTNILDLGLSALDIEGVTDLTNKPKKAAKWSKRHKKHGEQGDDAEAQGAARSG